MLRTERAGENNCGLWATEVVPPGERARAAGEYAGFGTGEPRSEMVQQYTSDGVDAAGLGAYKKLSGTLFRFIHRSIF
jgi:hypothetical protein